MPSVLVIPRRPVRQGPHDPMPTLWRQLVCEWLQAPTSLGQRLWRCFAKVATAEQRFLLAQADRRPGIEVLGPFFTVVRPRDLLELTVLLAPEGWPRPLEIRRLEEHILEKATAKDGSWL